MGGSLSRYMAKEETKQNLSAAGFPRGYNTKYGISVYAPGARLSDIEGYAREYGIRDGQGMSVVESIEMDWYRIARPSFDEDMELLIEDLLYAGYDVFAADKYGNQA